MNSSTPLQNGSPSFDLAVVGGGVIGLSVAWQAARSGLSTVVLERNGPGQGASHVAAGMLAATAEAEFGDREIVDLRLAGAELYPAFVAELEAESGLEVGYSRCGTLYVAGDRDQAEALEREVAFRVSLGLSAELLRPSQALKLLPSLAPRVRLAALLKGDHIVDPRRLCAALAEAFRRAGGELREGAQVSRVVYSPAGVVSGVAIGTGETVVAEKVVIAAGAWAKGLVSEGDELPVRPVKGQTVRLRDPTGPGLTDTIVRGEEFYLAPRGDGRYVLGASVEERGFDSAATVEPVFELLRAASELVPGVLELEIEELCVGFRPATPDGLPAIGPAATPGLFWAAGHYRNGILLAPITAELIVAYLTDEGSHPLAAHFLPTRYARGGREVLSQ